MATYKDDIDIIKAALKDDKTMTLNAITELDDKGLLGKYGGEGGGEEYENVTVTINNPINTTARVEYCYITAGGSDDKIVRPASLPILQNDVTDLDIVENSLVLIFSDNVDRNVVVDYTEGEVVKVADGQCRVYGPGKIFLKTGINPT